MFNWFWIACSRVFVTLWRSSSSVNEHVSRSMLFPSFCFQISIIIHCPRLSSSNSIFYKAFCYNRVKFPFSFLFITHNCIASSLERSRYELNIAQECLSIKTDVYKKKLKSIAHYWNSFSTNIRAFHHRFAQQPRRKNLILLPNETAGWQNNKKKGAEEGKRVMISCERNVLYSFSPRLSDPF